jgi:hypothetical protein
MQRAIIGVVIKSVAAIVLIGAIHGIIICPSYTFVFACARGANSFRITLLCIAIAADQTDFPNLQRRFVDARSVSHRKI